MELPDAERIARLHAAVLAWFELRGRRFAFRGTRDPYAVLVSELILQQTQAGRGEPAWTAFMARFPNFAALATASPADVLRAWGGLGYNRRAVALHRTARVVVERHAGRLPDDMAALRALPGIGPYTARAILAIAHGRPVGAVDTNVRRVLGRVFAGHGSRLDAGSALSPRAMQALADDVVPVDRPADWTAALMDIGAAVCRPRRPACAACPLAGDCRWAQDHLSGDATGRIMPAPAHLPGQLAAPAHLPGELAALSSARQPHIALVSAGPPPRAPASGGPPPHAPTSAGPPPETPASARSPSDAATRIKWTPPDPPTSSVLPSDAATRITSARAEARRPAGRPPDAATRITGKKAEAPAIAEHGPGRRPAQYARTGRAAERPAPYEATRRWLRGRIVERLRTLPDGAWVTLEAPLGVHDADAVADALVALEREGLVERDRVGRVRLPH